VRLGWPGRTSSTENDFSWAKLNHRMHLPTLPSQKRNLFIAAAQQKSHLSTCCVLRNRLITGSNAAPFCFPSTIFSFSQLQSKRLLLFILTRLFIGYTRDRCWCWCRVVKRRHFFAQAFKGVFTRRMTGATRKTLFV
jgi:hypothetical protein